MLRCHFATKGGRCLRGWVSADGSAHGSSLPEGLLSLRIRRLGWGSPGLLGLLVRLPVFKTFPVQGKLSASSNRAVVNHRSEAVPHPHLATMGGHISTVRRLADGGVLRLTPPGVASGLVVEDDAADVVHDEGAHRHDRGSGSVIREAASDLDAGVSNVVTPAEWMT